MVFSITVGNIIREFAVYFPIGWEYWVQQITTEHGLPLLVAFHGGGQDFETFLTNWNFVTVQNQDAVLANKFVLLVPLGFSTQWDAVGEPERVWRAWNQLVPNTEVDDALFVKLAIDHVSAMIDTAYTAAGIVNRATLDSRRRYLFGYSNGGMMAYKCANSTQFAQGYWAAVWAFASTIGGRRYALANNVVNTPRAPVGSQSFSLFCHHGGGDTTVPPGPTTTTVNLQRSTSFYDTVRTLGNVPNADADLISIYYQPLRRAVKEYLDRNNAAFATFPVTDQVPSQTQNNQPDNAGGTSSTRLTWRRANTTNPEVVEYRDPTMDHTNYFGTGRTQYFRAVDVWTWLYAHLQTLT